MRRKTSLIVLVILLALWIMMQTACAFKKSASSPISTSAQLSRQPSKEGLTALPTPAPLIPAGGAKWRLGRLVFSDEFDGPQLDTHKWDTQYWNGRTNLRELGYYAPDAFEFISGTLRLKAEQRRMEKMSYTSGMISSYRKFDLTYGYVEMRSKIPRGQGLWPAFWLLTYEKLPLFEIDIMEIIGHEPQRVHTTIHYRESNDMNLEDGNVYEGADFSANFHLFAVEWNSNAIIWYIDNVECYRVTHHVPQQPMYIIANLAVGGDWPGSPDRTTHFPAYFEIDYIRAYQLQQTP